MQKNGRGDQKRKGLMDFFSNCIYIFLFPFLRRLPFFSPAMTICPLSPHASRIERIEFLDELEEWHLMLVPLFVVASRLFCTVLLTEGLQGHYCLCLAVFDKKDDKTWDLPSLRLRNTM